MKKLPSTLLTIIICFILAALVACGKINNESNSSENEENNSGENIKDNVGESVDFTEWLEFELSGNGDSYIVTDYYGAFENVVIPSKYKDLPVTGIGDSAFSNCTCLESITIPDSVTSIAGHAFCGCEGLTGITIPDSVTSIGFRAFNGTAYYNNESNWENGVLYIRNHLIETGYVLLESYEIKNGTKTIADYAFYNCTRLKSVNIPNSVTSIGDFAFTGCDRLTSVIIGNGLKSIGDYAFYNCVGIMSITIPDNVKRIGQYAFENCDGLTSVTIGNGVKSIGPFAFENCAGLTRVNIISIEAWCGNSFDDHFSNPLYYANLYLDGNLVTDLVIPDSVTSIGNYAFENCDGLTSVTIGNGVNSINVGAFSGCSGLTSVTIPDSVTSIGIEAFEGCTGLTSVTIPNSVTSISKDAFLGCEGLTSVNFEGTIAQWKAIQKGELWNNDTGDYTVHCTDGDISKSES